MIMVRIIDIVAMVLLAEAVLGGFFALGAFDEKQSSPVFVTSSLYTVEPAIPEPSNEFDAGVAVASVLMGLCKVGFAMVCVLPFLTTLFGIPLPVAAVIQVFIYWMYSRALTEIRTRPSTSDMFAPAHADAK